MTPENYVKWFARLTHDTEDAAYEKAAEACNEISAEFIKEAQMHRGPEGVLRGTAAEYEFMRAVMECHIAIRALKHPKKKGKN